MDKEKQKLYTARIAQANRSELVVIIYELILDSVEAALGYYKTEQTEEARKEMERAQGLLQELRGSLDFQYGLSFKLRELYRYIYEQYTASIVRQKPVQLDACQRIIRGLKESFEEVARQDTSGPVMEHTQQIYAGLTYGKGSLNEVAIDGAGKENRDFRV